MRKFVENNVYVIPNVISIQEIGPYGDLAPTVTNILTTS